MGIGRQILLSICCQESTSLGDYVMTQETNTETIYRTTPGRTTKMMVIMLGLCLIGGVIFIGMWDYWISIPAQGSLLPKESTTSDSAGSSPAVQTGKLIPITLSFIESDDFLKLAFNALPGEDDNNPTIYANVGDKIEFTVDNAGRSFHSFGVTRDDSGFDNIFDSSAIGSVTNALKPGEDGTSNFVPGESGTYYYICTVPGHREQGMVGEIIVTESTSKPIQAAPPTGVEREFDLNFVESDDFLKLAFNALPGEEGNNPDIVVSSGDEVTINTRNDGISFHAFGVVNDPDDISSIVWNSDIGSVVNSIKPSESGSVTFTAGAPGTYYYICTVPGHAQQGMKGTFTVT